jgi:CRISPR-associated endonuclease/helicase Cas3
MRVEVTLEAQSERRAGPGHPHLLYHQWRTAQELRNAPLVMNTYNTGTGKTRASLLYLDELPRDGESHVLFVAPTNELLHQHTNDIRAYVESHHLPFAVVELNAERLRALGSTEIVDRQGERLVRLLRNPYEFADQLGLERSAAQATSLILVTNPDLFYYAFYWQFAAPDQRNLFAAFITSFRYVVIDEFHYYSSKQLASLLLFVILSRVFGYFEGNERRFCLLSATPSAEVTLYLDRIFGPGGWKLVAPENEPPEAQQLEQVAVLGPVNLVLQAGTVDEFAAREADSLRQWLAEGRDGALISGALWRVNDAYARLHPKLQAGSTGRITGAQPLEERRRDQFKPLILATPTVDIGYNFVKHNKARQNLDFVVFDAKFQDEFFQRLGRAGRVLGKPEQDVPSSAIALLSDESIARFAAVNGQTLTRQEFAAFVRRTEAIGTKDDFSAYLRAGGMFENVSPILHAQRMFAQADASILEQAFDAIKEVFAPQSAWSYKRMTGYWARYQIIVDWLRDSHKVQPSKLTRLMAEFLGWSVNQTAQEGDVAGHETVLLSNNQIVGGFRTWCEMQAALIRSHFHFRDSFGGPVGTVFDPAHLLSSADLTEYDLIHIVENYEFEHWEPAIFAAKTGMQPADDALCVRLRSHRQVRQRVSLQWSPPDIRYEGWSREEFERCFAAGAPVAIKGILLNVGEPLPEPFRAALKREYVPVLLVPASLRGSLLRVTRPRNIYSRDLTVRLPGLEVTYAALLGTSALLIAPLLGWAFGLQQREQDTAIIC